MQLARGRAFQAGGTEQRPGGRNMLVGFKEKPREASVAQGQGHEVSSEYEGRGTMGWGKGLGRAVSREGP